MMESWDECKDKPGVYAYWLVAHYWGFALLLDPVFVAAAFMVRLVFLRARRVWAWFGVKAESD